MKDINNLKFILLFNCSLLGAIFALRILCWPMRLSGENILVWFLLLRGETITTETLTKKTFNWGGLLILQRFSPSWWIAWWHAGRHDVGAESRISWLRVNRKYSIHQEFLTCQAFYLAKPNTWVNLKLTTNTLLSQFWWQKVLTHIEGKQFHSSPGNHFLIHH